MISSTRSWKTASDISIKIIPAISGILASVLFSLFAYPHIAGHIENKLTTDRYDDLARGIVTFGTLSYFPDNEPTVLRTPLYPLLVAGCMALAGNDFAIPALALQAILHGATVLIATLLALRFAGRKAAMITGVLCAVHPMLLWYSGRLVIETLSTFLYTLAVFATVLYWMRPSISRAASVGATIGICLWCKAAYLPLLIVVPIAILTGRKHPGALRETAVLVCTCMLVIAPWTVRNYMLTDRWPVFQALVGYNLYVSDSFVEHAAESPFGYAGLISRIDFEGMNPGFTLSDSLHPNAWREATHDEALARRSVSLYFDQPGFLLKKILFNAFWIWALGSTPGITLFMAIIQGSLLGLSVLSARTILRNEGWGSAMLVPLWMACIYLVVHLPVYALARFSVVVIPSLIAFAVSASILKIPKPR